MLEVPPSILEMLHLSEGAAVEMAVEHGGLVVKPLLRPKYTLDELLAKCDATAESITDHPWSNFTPVGNELELFAGLKTV